MLRGRASQTLNQRCLAGWLSWRRHSRESPWGEGAECWIAYAEAGGSLFLSASRWGASCAAHTRARANARPLQQPACCCSCTPLTNHVPALCLPAGMTHMQTHCTANST